MYTFDSRYDILKSTIIKGIRPSSIINYFQDCSTFQSEDMNLGLSKIEIIKSMAAVKLEPSDSGAGLFRRLYHCRYMAVCIQGLLRIP